LPRGDAGDDHGGSQSSGFVSQLVGGLGYGYFYRGQKFEATLTAPISGVSNPTVKIWQFAKTRISPLLNAVEEKGVASYFMSKVRV
jgi:hypothetical protein